MFLSTLIVSKHSFAKPSATTINFKDFSPTLQACPGQLARHLNAARQDCLARARALQSDGVNSSQVSYEELENKFCELCSAAVDAETQH